MLLCFPGWTVQRGQAGDGGGLAQPGAGRDHCSRGRGDKGDDGTTSTTQAGASGNRTQLSQARHLSTTKNFKGQFLNVFNQQVTDVLLIRLQTRRTCVQDPGLPATPAPAPGPRGPAQPQPQPGPQEPVLGPGTVPEVARVNGSLVTPVSRLEFRDLLDPPTRCLRPRTLRIPDARDPKWVIPTEKTPL